MGECINLRNLAHTAPLLKPQEETYCTWHNMLLLYATNKTLSSRAELLSDIIKSTFLPEPSVPCALLKWQRVICCWVLLTSSPDSHSSGIDSNRSRRAGLHLGLQTGAIINSLRLGEIIPGQGDTFPCETTCRTQTRVVYLWRPTGQRGQGKGICC